MLVLIQVVKVESSIALLEEPCVRQISQRVGLVLKLPPQGFDTCKTHSELSNLYANKFDILPSDPGIKHESVVAISNHSLLFSEKEVQLTEADWLEHNEEKQVRKFKAKKNLLGITPSNQMLSTQIQISENVDKEKAVELIKDFIEKVSLEKGRDKAGLIIGADLVGQNAVIISGEYFNILVAKELILMKLRKHRVPYTEEECDK